MLNHVPVIPHSKQRQDADENDNGHENNNDN
jgi:hypothetical protein